MSAGKGGGPGRATVTYKHVNGIDILADVALPAGRGPFPVVLYLHGGALILGSRGWIADGHLDAYLSDGHAVVAIDYRLAPETKLAAIATDLDDAIDWVRNAGAERFDLDPGRVAAVGHSAGAYLALLAGTRARPPLQAIVTFYGYGDILGDWYTRPSPHYLQEPPVTEADARAGVGTVPIADLAGIDDEPRRRFYLWCRQQGAWPREVGGIDPSVDAAGLEPWCPLRHISPTFPPTLLLHGDGDTDVPHEQSVLMAAAIRAEGVPAEMVTIRGGGHGFDGHPEQPDVAAAFGRVTAFLAAHLG